MIMIWFFLTRSIVTIVSITATPTKTSLWYSSLKTTLGKTRAKSHYSNGPKALNISVNFEKSSKLAKPTGMYNVHCTCIKNVHYVHLRLHELIVR
jgi:hypothetical protein